ncbi:MAG: response regulator [Gemmatimonadota bacterium]
MMPYDGMERTEGPHGIRRANSNGRARILVAEDHTDSRDAICALLEALGFDVLAATDGYEAVQIAGREAPDLVLMDVMMPKVDGLQAIRLLRGARSTRETPIIALTALDGVESHARRVGADDFVVKPLNMATLERKLRKWLGARTKPPDRYLRARARFR